MNPEYILLIYIFILGVASRKLSKQFLARKSAIEYKNKLLLIAKKLRAFSLFFIIIINTVIAVLNSTLFHLSGDKFVTLVIVMTGLGITLFIPCYSLLHEFEKKDS